MLALRDLFGYLSSGVVRGSAAPPTARAVAMQTIAGVRHAAHQAPARDPQLSDALLRAEGYAPSFEEIAGQFNYNSLATVHEHLTNLERKGYIKRTYNESRAIEILPSEIFQRAVELPLLGLVAAGMPIEAIGHGDDGGPRDFVRARGGEPLRAQGPRQLDDRRADPRRRLRDRERAPARRQRRDGHRACSTATRRR